MYIIIELQTTGGVTANIVKTEESLNEAMNMYHSILASAAISKVEYHTAMVINEEGQYIARDCFKHLTEVGTE